MRDDRVSVENTDLIDVSDVEPMFEEEVQTEREGRTSFEPLPEILPVDEEPVSGIATLKDRSAAFFIDILFLYAIYWILMIIYRSIAIGTAAGPVPFWSVNGIVFHSLFLLIALLWFVIPEMAFSASPGKLFCRLAIRASDGSYASFLSVLVRNILRPVDALLFPLLLTAGLMEKTKWHRRIGDIIGGTVVLRNLRSPPRQYALSLEMIAAASGRVLSFIIDLALLTLFALGLALLLNPDEQISSMLIVVFSPIAFFLFFAIPEWLTKTTPGKWIMGYIVCHEDGSSLDLSSTIVRTIWRIFDMNIFGFMTCLFSLRHQRPGDGAAGSVVIKSRRELRGALGLAAILVISAGTLYAGMENRDSFLSGDFKINFLPALEFGVVPSSKAAPAPPNLMARNFRFAVGSPDNLRKPSIFKPGETVYILFDLSGYKQENKKVWLEEDLSIRYPDDSIGLKLENINEINRELEQEGLISFENSVTIPANAMPGRYSATITVRDKLSRQEMTDQRFFYITPNETPGTAIPPPVSPPLNPAPVIIQEQPATGETVSPGQPVQIEKPADEPPFGP